MIASDALGPVTDREAGSIEAAHGLMTKASSVVSAVYKLLFEVFPPDLHKRLRWPSEAALLNAAAQTFRKTGEFHGFGGGIFYGITAEEGTAYWFIGVTVESGSKGGVEELRKAAKTKLDTAIWDRPATGLNVLLARVRATSLGARPEVVAWFTDRLRELAASGVVRLATGLEPARATR
jgi:hypothetical protein